VNISKEFLKFTGAVFLTGDILAKYNKKQFVVMHVQYIEERW